MRKKVEEATSLFIFDALGNAIVFVHIYAYQTLKHFEDIFDQDERKGHVSFWNLVPESSQI